MRRLIHDKDGPIVSVRVTKPDGRGGKQETPAKVDTGATMTCIPESCLKGLRLTTVETVTLIPFDRTQIPTKFKKESEPSRHSDGLRNLIPKWAQRPKRTEVELGPNEYLAFEVSLVVENFAHAVPLKVAAIPGRETILLGRDFLKHAELNYNGAKGWFELIEA